jgi:hypothetical protein
MSHAMKEKGESADAVEQLASLTSLAKLRALSEVVQKHEAQILTLQGFPSEAYD